MRARVDALALATLVLASCMDPTPFGTDTEEHDLNHENSERLLANTTSGPLRFVAIGDSHDAFDQLAATVDHINARTDIDAVVHVGDITNFGLLKEFEWTQRALSRLKVPVLVAIGNHDAISSGKAVYQNMYGAFDFALVYKRHKLVLFNSNYLEFSDSAPDRAWLETQLSDLQGADSAILITHQNLRASDGPASFYESMIREHPVSLIVHGHLEEFALDDWAGVPILQCSTFQKTGIYTIVTMVDQVPSFEVCRADQCIPWTAGVPRQDAP